MKITDEFFDIVLFVIVMGLTVPYAFSTMYGTFQENPTVVEDTLKDKTSLEYKGQEQEINSDLDTLNRAQVILTSQVQDSNMPDKKIYEVRTIKKVAKEYNLEGNTSYPMKANLDRVSEEVFSRLDRLGNYKIVTRIDEKGREMYSIQDK